MDRGREIARQRMLCLAAQLGAALRQVENVDRGLTFRIDKRNLDVAFMRAEREGNLPQKARNVLCHNLQNRGMRRGLRVKLQTRRNLDLCVRSVACVASCLQHLLHWNLLPNHIVQVIEKAVFLTRIQFNGAEHVSELEAVHHYAGII